MLSARRSPLASPLITVGALVASALLGACTGGGGEPGTTAASTVQVSASDRSCELDRTDLGAGTASFAITNTGDKTTEVYVYAADGGGNYTTVLAEVENIGPGLSRTMEAQLGPGRYEVACKPGQSGEGIRTRLTVVGNGGDNGGGESAAGESEVAYDREIELSTDGTTITGEELAATSGEKIEFKVENKAQGPITFELKTPDSDVAGEVESIKPGATGELVAALDETGEWQIVIERDGRESLSQALPVS